MAYFKVLCTFQIVSGFFYDICCFELVNKLYLTPRPDPDPATNSETTKYKFSPNKVIAVQER